MNLLIMGPAGSGKGTQAAKIVEKYGVKHITMGGLLRDEVAKGNERSKMLEEMMEKGVLVPNEITNELLLEAVKKSDKGVLLDGYPRNIGQALWLDENVKIDKAISIKLSDEVAVRRISGRWMCKDCGEIFHEQTKPPKEAGKCDVCGGELYQRDDDKAESVKERLKIYHNQTDEAVEHFKEQGLVVEINGEQSIDDVWKDIDGVLGE